MLLTPISPAALAVIRLDGPGIDGLLAKRFSKPVAIGKGVHGRLLDDDGVIDDPMVIRFEKHAELHLHGGLAIIEGVIRLLKSHGFAEAEVSNKETIAEKVQRLLPLARTRLAVQTLLNQPKAHQEQGRVQIGQALKRLLYPPTVAIVGVPNAGKSSLANRLFARDRTIVADVPGTTRDYVSDESDIDGLIVHLLDTPGVRDTKDPIEQHAIRLAQEKVKSADLQIVLLDLTQDLNPQLAMIEQGHESRLLVGNKCDLVRPTSAVDVRVRAGTGEGIDLLRRAIFARLMGGDFSPANAYDF
jgi:small GTP-binding protein